jgi:hypothetical protein
LVVARRVETVQQIFVGDGTVWWEIDEGLFRRVGNIGGWESTLSDIQKSWQYAGSPPGWPTEIKT